MAGVREAGTVERGGKDFGEGRRGRGEEEALYSLQYEIKAHQGRGIVEDQSLSANTVFRSALTAS